MRSSKQQEIGAAECPSGEGTSGIKVYRGFVEWGDKDLYEYELNCKSIAANLASIRGLPDLKMLGLSRNVLTWDSEQLGTWLDALGLGDLVASFEAHNVDGGTVFLLTEEHLKELGFNLVGDRLYFVEVLTQLYDDIVNWSAALGIQLATHPVPPLRKLGLPLTPTSWSVKDVCKVLKAVNLGEYMELFVEHRVQGDVLFSLTEENLKEMGVSKVGDRLLITGTQRCGPCSERCGPCSERCGKRALASSKGPHSSRRPWCLQPSKRAPLLVHAPPLSCVFSLATARPGVDALCISDWVRVSTLSANPSSADITQTLYEQITGWQNQQVKQQNLLQLAGGGA